MIAVRVGPELRMACVAAPTYFAVHDMPQVPQDLAQHRCINMRMAPTSALYAWEFEKDGRQLNYYPSRRQPTPVFALVVDALRYRS